MSWIPKLLPEPLQRFLRRRRLRKKLNQAPYSRSAVAELLAELTRHPASPPTSPTPSLILYATIFPRLSCSFNLVEYRALLDQFPGSLCYTSGTDFHTGSDRPTFTGILKDYLALYTRHAGRIRKMDLSTSFFASLFYTIFLSNIHDCLPLLEATRTPFIFRLYLGGEWCVGNEGSDRMLDRVLRSPQFRHVITVDPATECYVREKWKLTPNQLSYAPGWMVDTLTLYSAGANRPPAPTQQICFVGMKSAPGGKNKGFDVFVEVAKQLARKFPAMVFHVVGSCGPEDADVSELGSRIVFHGVQKQDFFPRFYPNMDLILSPNLPNSLAPGHLEGAPNVTNVEAGLCGCLVVMTDQSRLNVLFEPDRHLVVVPHDAQAITRRLESLYKDPNQLLRLATDGRERFREVCDSNRMLPPLFDRIAQHLPTRS